jgi:branched-chain amino acid transport system permease protein
MVEQQLVNGLMLGSIYVLVAVAFTLTIGVLNFLNFSIPGIFMIGGMFTWAALGLGVPWIPAVVLVLLAGAAASLVVERFTYRWMRASDHFVPLVSSMAFLILMENLVLNVWGSDLQRVAVPFPNVSVHVAGLIVSLPQLVGLAVTVALVSALSLVLRRTRVGRGLRTIAESPDTAIMLGVDIFRVVPVVFVISGLFTAFGGILFALNYQQVQPFMGEEVALKGISAMIVGGMGSIWGAVAGGLLIGVAEVVSIQLVGADFVDIVVYGLLLLILMARPTGLFGAAALGKGKL